MEALWRWFTIIWSKVLIIILQWQLLMFKWWNPEKFQGQLTLIFYKLIHKHERNAKSSLIGTKKLFWTGARPPNFKHMIKLNKGVLYMRFLGLKTALNELFQAPTVRSGNLKGVRAERLWHATKKTPKKNLEKPTKWFLGVTSCNFRAQDKVENKSPFNKVFGLATTLHGLFRAPTVRLST